MISRQFLRENPDVVRDAVEKKGVDDVDVDRILAVDEEWRDLKARGDDLRHERNEVSSEIGRLKQEGEDERARAAIASVGSIDGQPVGTRVRGASGTVRACEEKYIGGRPERKVRETSPTRA